MMQILLASSTCILGMSVSVLILHRAAVDEGKKQITALSVCPGKLPTSYVLKGSLKWIEK